MAIKFHILQSNGILTGATSDKLKTALQETAANCCKKLTLDDVDVVVMNVPWNVIPRIGVNGFSYDAHQIILSLDCEHEYLKSNFNNTISSILAHELHHSARALSRGTSHSRTYAGNLVAEGLACCFEEEMGHITPFYAIECKGNALQNFSEKAKEYVHTKQEHLPGGWRQWLVGRFDDNSDFPYSCGYSTGYALVRNWLEAEGISASTAAGVDENEVINMWLNGSINPFE